MNPPRQSHLHADAIAARAQALRAELARTSPDDERRVELAALAELYDSGLRTDIDRAFRAPTLLKIRCAGPRCGGKLLARVYRTSAAPVLVPVVAGLSVQRAAGQTPEGVLRRDEWGRGRETVLTRARRARTDGQVELDCRRCTSRWVQVEAVFTWLDRRTRDVAV